MYFTGTSVQICTSETEKIKLKKKYLSKNLSEYLPEWYAYKNPKPIDSN